MTKFSDNAIQLFHDDEEDRITRNHINVQVFQLLEDIEYAGSHVSPRGQKVKEATLATLEIDPIYSAMSFEPRKFNWKYFAGELAWYLMRTDDIAFINNFSSFWKQICTSGQCNSNYGHILLQSHPSLNVEVHESLHSEVNQMEWVYNCLKNDKFSRQAIAFLNTPYYQKSGTETRSFPNANDFVCTLYLNFWIRDNKLYMKVQMRSNDIFFGLSYDAPWFSTLHQSMYLNLKNIYEDLELGTYYHCADNIHYYERHFEMANKVLEAPLLESISMKLRKPLFVFDENGVFSLSKEAETHREEVSRLVESGKIDKMKMDDWKKQLGSLFEIG